MRAPEGHAVGVGVLLGPPVVRERDGGQRLLGLGLGVDLAQLLHRDQGLGRQLVAALGQPAAALLLHPRAAQDERGLAVERAQGLPERLGVGVLGAELCQFGWRQLAHAVHLGADGLLRVRRRAGRELDRWRFRFLRLCLVALLLQFLDLLVRAGVGSGVIIVRTVGVRSSSQFFLERFELLQQILFLVDQRLVLVLKLGAVQVLAAFAVLVGIIGFIIISSV